MRFAYCQPLFLPSTPSCATSIRQCLAIAQLLLCVNQQSRDGEEMPNLNSYPGSIPGLEFMFGIVNSWHCQLLWNDKPERERSASNSGSTRKAWWEEQGMQVRMPSLTTCPRQSIACQLANPLNQLRMINHYPLHKKALVIAMGRNGVTQKLGTAEQPNIRHTIQNCIV